MTYEKKIMKIATGAIATSSEQEEVVEKAKAFFQEQVRRSIHPTTTTITFVLGSISCALPEVVLKGRGLSNSTRWVLDVEHVGSEAVEIPIQLLSNAGRLVCPEVISFSFGAMSKNFYYAKPFLLQKIDGLVLKTSSLKEKATVNYRLSLDIIHSSNR